MLSEYVMERLARLVAENRPRPAEPARPTPSRAAGSGKLSDPTAKFVSRGRSQPAFDPLDFGPSDDDGSDAERGHLSSAREASTASTAPTTPPQAELTFPPDVLEDWGDPQPRSRFSRSHLVVVTVLLVLGLLGAGWSVLRARPVAIASTPVGVSSAAATTPARGASVSSPPAAATPKAEIVVHVLGAVKRPGVVTLPEPGRVRDALRAAGGLAGNADPGELNLAQVLADGEQLVIGTTKHPVGEVREQTSSLPAGSTKPGSGSQSLVDLNRATEIQLEELPGVGPVTAARIVAWRSEHNRFNRVEELQEVEGIGPKTFADIAPHVRV